jgi:hypothetical protein
MFYAFRSNKVVHNWLYSTQYLIELIMVIVYGTT